MNKPDPEILAQIKGLTNNTIEIGEFRNQTFVILYDKEYLKKVVEYLKKAGFNHLQTLTAVDYWQQDPKFRFEVIYQFYHLSKRISLRLRVKVSEEEPILDSIVDLYPAVNFLEREVYDLFGIKFQGHPNLKRILLPDYWEGHPLRKDYPLEPEEKPKEFTELIKLKESLKEYGVK